MNHTIDAVISGVGGHLPKRIVTNDDLAKIVDTSDEWIRSRSGIAERRFAADDEVTSDIASAAALKALKNADLRPQDIDMVIVATVTPDNTFPAVAVYVQRNLEIPPCPAFDLSAACGGFVYALSLARNAIAVGEVRHALVIGAEKLSCFLDFEDRSTCVLFGDGAGAVVLSASERAEGEPQQGVIATHINADGRKADFLYADGGPASTATVGHPQMSGKEVFRNAVHYISDAVVKVSETAGVALSDIDWFVPHQANIRIIDSCAQKLKIDKSRVIVTIDKHANTSSASIPLALDVAISDGRIKRGQLVVFAALGGGMAWGGALVRY